MLAPAPRGHHARADKLEQAASHTSRAKIRVMDSVEWPVVFYTPDGGESPVAQFLDSLGRSTHGRFVWSIEQLRLRNVHAREPLVRHLEGRLWELRRESNTNIYRIVYTVLPGRRILFLHGFQKKTQKTPRADIVRAQRRLLELIREGEDAI